MIPDVESLDPFPHLKLHAMNARTGWSPGVFGAVAAATRGSPRICAKPVSLQPVA